MSKLVAVYDAGSGRLYDPQAPHGSCICIISDTLQGVAIEEALNAHGSLVPSHANRANVTPAGNNPQGSDYSARKG